MSFTLAEITNQQINTQLSVKDNNGQVTALSGMKDESGETVLRVVDAAPFAYDPSTDKLQVAAVQANATRMEEVFSGSLAAATSKDIYIPFLGESEVWVLVETSQSPWKIRTGSFVSLEGAYDNTFFPKIGSTQNTTHTSANPFMALFLPLGISTAGNFPYPTTIDEAKRYPLTPGRNDFRFRFYNDSANASTVKLSVLRVWK